MDNRFLGVLVPLVFCVSLPACAAQTLQRPDAPDPVNPFLHAPAQSLLQLVREVRRDAVARHFYADFFHIPESKVGPYLSKNLQSATLHKAGNYTVYFVSIAGDFYPTRMALSPGTPVFVGHGGVPVLLRGAGNPVVPFSMVIYQSGNPSSVLPGNIQEKVVPATSAEIPLPASAP